jgi:hypothetical protein
VHAVGIDVTLVLAVTAVQFVVNSDRPESSYVLPTQQLVIASAFPSPHVSCIFADRTCFHQRSPNKETALRFGSVFEGR